MNRPKTYILSLVTFSACLLPCIVSAQTAQRDRQAISIINQTLAAGGGAALLSTIQDFTGTGSITYYWDPQVNGSMTVKGRGLGQFRIDATLPNGRRTAPSQQHMQSPIPKRGFSRANSSSFVRSGSSVRCEL